jgi:hypothetical protein
MTCVHDVKSHIGGYSLLVVRFRHSTNESREAFGSSQSISSKLSNETSIVI